MTNDFFIDYIKNKLVVLSRLRTLFFNLSTSSQKKTNVAQCFEFFKKCKCLCDTNVWYKRIEYKLVSKLPSCEPAIGGFKMGSFWSAAIEQQQTDFHAYEPVNQQPFHLIRRCGLPASQILPSRIKWTHTDGERRTQAHKIDPVKWFRIRISVSHNI